MKLSPSDISQIESALDQAGYDDGATVIEALELHKAFIDGLKADLEAGRNEPAFPVDQVHQEAKAVLARRLESRGDR
ncbi:MAG: hypothetical protein NXI12_11915 [Alphaproteobacteria bacterium]|nr:hypothetical protein [Alphaproteobacteria bacterium]